MILNIKGISGFLFEYNRIIRFPATFHRSPSLARLLDLIAVILDLFSLRVGDFGFFREFFLGIFRSISLLRRDFTDATRFLPFLFLRGITGAC